MDETTLAAPFTHRIRSFVKRDGRLTESQNRALTELWPQYGIEFDQAPDDLQSCFSRAQPLKLEIGFGNGEALLQIAAQDPDCNFIGIEVHRPGVGYLLNQLKLNNINNVRLMSHDAIEVLQHRIGNQSLSRVMLFFPDPWHKKRHHKRRIVNPLFRDLVAQKLQPQGVLHMATDWPDYAEWMQHELQQDQRFGQMDPGQGQQLNPRPSTRFERRGQKRGHPICDLYYQRRQSPPPPESS